MDLDLLNKPKVKYYQFDILSGQGIIGYGVVKTLLGYFHRERISKILENKIKESGSNADKYRIGSFFELKKEEYESFGFNDKDPNNEKDIVISYEFYIV